MCAVVKPSILSLHGTLHLTVQNKRARRMTCSSIHIEIYSAFFFLNDPATPEISPLPLHDALPIFRPHAGAHLRRDPRRQLRAPRPAARHSSFGCWRRRPPIRGQSLPDKSQAKRYLTSAVRRDRKSTRLNSSHLVISYAVFCLKTKR